jgi:hypothetical protein
LSANSLPFNKANTSTGISIPFIFSPFSLIPQ